MTSKTYAVAAVLWAAVIALVLGIGLRGQTAVQASPDEPTVATDAQSSTGVAAQAPVAAPATTAPATESSAIAKPEQQPDKAEGAKANAKPSAGKGNQTLCPIMGSKIKKDVYADYEGRRIYFCCTMCPPTFKKNPAKYVKEMEAKGIVLEKRQTTCPITGKPIDKKLYVDSAGKRIYVCCPKCVDGVKKDAGKIIEKFEKEGIVLDTPSAGKAK